jgi:hypothetical protein
VRERREDERVGLVGLAGQGSKALDLLRIGDLDRPALPLERVVDDPGAGHRLDDGADRFAMDLVDPPRQRAQRVDVGRGDELSSCAPCAESMQTSSFRRLRSNPACNM